MLHILWNSKQVPPVPASLGLSLGRRRALRPHTQNTQNRRNWGARHHSSN